MTREEAITYAKRVIDLSLNDETQAFCKMAIEALEQEPCEDCVSRQAAIDTIESWLSCNDYNKAERHIMRAMQSVLYDLPSATPQPKTGHWIGHREHCENLGVMPSGLGAYEWCSICDCGIDVREWHRNHYNYCPNCGTKMVEPQAESEE